MSKTIIITGGNGGLALWTAKYLLDKGFSLIMACRNIEKAKQDIQHFKQLDKYSNYSLVPLDLSDFESIKNFVAHLAISDVYGLICNAGMSYSGQIRYSKQGIEETFSANYLGHFLLTDLLLKKYEITRILFIASGLHDPDIKSPFAPAKFKPIREMAFPDTTHLNKKSFQEFYATAKLCEILLAYELDRRWNGNAHTKKYFINAFNPGLMSLTNLGRGKNTIWERIGRYLLHGIGNLFGFATSAKISGRYAAMHLTETNESGKYFEKDKAVPSSKDSYDLNKAKLLWEGSEELVGR